MKRIILFAGTTEGRRLSECLVQAGIPHTVYVATEYGEVVLQESPLVTVHCGRIDQAAIADIIKQSGDCAVIDATHPYAAVVTENIRLAVEDARRSAPAQELLLLRLERQNLTEGAQDASVVSFANAQECAEALAHTTGNILLTTGSKELAVYGASEEVRSRLYVRVLPSVESLELCEKQGICAKQILALQGPFTTQMNEAMLRQYQISCLVTKASGRTGGFPEKLEAAKRAGVSVYVVQPSAARTEETGYPFEEVCKRLEVFLEQTIHRQGRFRITLAGIGMGSQDTITQEVQTAIAKADILLGAARMIEAYQPRLEKQPFYTADKILSYLKELQHAESAADEIKVVILFSGDSGFYSGTQAVYQALQEAIAKEQIPVTEPIRVLAGISSVSYLAACIGESYQDAAISSIHGRRSRQMSEQEQECIAYECIRTVSGQEKTFLLLSGAEDVRWLGNKLLEAQLGHCRLTLGYQLSQSGQQIIELTPAQCQGQENTGILQEGLYTCFIRNPKPQKIKLTHGMPDTAFLRDKVPMTKEEVREISISKLQLCQDAIVYDIGSGTGSIAMEIASLSSHIRVYAIEHKEKAAELIQRNRQKFGLANVTIIKGEAPECFAQLPAPTHAFIGGSNGTLQEILSALYRLNAHMRVVINAVSMETISEITRAVSSFSKDFFIEKEEIVQVQVSRAAKAGTHHLMQAENPVWICAFSFCEGTVSDVKEDTI